MSGVYRSYGPGFTGPDGLDYVIVYTSTDDTLDELVCARCLAVFGANDDGLPVGFGLGEGVHDAAGLLELVLVCEDGCRSDADRAFVTWRLSGIKPDVNSRDPRDDG